MKIHYVQTLRAVNGIPEGEILAVENGDGVWIVVDGLHKGKEIQGYDCKAITPEQVAFGNDCPNGKCDV